MQEKRVLGFAVSIITLVACAAGEDISSRKASNAGSGILGASGSDSSAGSSGAGGNGGTGSAPADASPSTSAGGAGTAAIVPMGASGNNLSGQGGNAAVVLPPSTCATAPVGGANDKLIDDMEDGDGKVSPAGGRGGDWFTYHDMTAGTQHPAQGAPIVPEASDRAGSTKAMHTSGSGFADWGAGLGVALHLSCPYDGSAYSGLSFYAKGTGPLTIKVKTAPTAPTAEGGSCATNCYDHFKKVIALGAVWTRYDIAWADLAQGGWGTPATFSPSALIGINFEVVTMPGTPITFDFWIDDLTFE